MSTCGNTIDVRTVQSRPEVFFPPEPSITATSGVNSIKQCPFFSQCEAYIPLNNKEQGMGAYFQTFTPTTAVVDSWKS